MIKRIFLILIFVISPIYVYANNDDFVLRTYIQTETHGDIVIHHDTGMIENFLLSEMFINGDFDLAFDVLNYYEVGNKISEIINNEISSRIPSRTFQFNENLPPFSARIHNDFSLTSGDVISFNLTGNGAQWVVFQPGGINFFFNGTGRGTASISHNGLWRVAIENSSASTSRISGSYTVFFSNSFQ